MMDRAALEALKKLNPIYGNSSLCRIHDALALDWITRLESGEKGHEAHGIAKALIEDFCTAAWSNLPQNRHILEWLANRLSDILAYKTYKPEGAGTRSKNKVRPMTAQEVFSLMDKPPHRSGGQHDAMAREVAMWLRATELRGYSATEAIEFATSVWHRDKVSIKRYKGDGKAWADGMNLTALGDIAELFELRGKPLPSAKT